MTNQGKQYIGFVNTIHASTEAERDAETQRQYREIAKKAEEDGAQLVAMFGSADLEGNTLSSEESSTPHYVEDYVVTHPGVTLVISEAHQFFFGTDWYVFLKSYVATSQIHGSTIETCSGPTIEQIMSSTDKRTTSELA